MSDTPKLSHFDAKGEAHMVDVSDKAVTSRIATAEGFVKMAQASFEIISEGRAKKGDVLAVAQLAGIMGAKHCATLIPLCHPLPITKVAVDLTLDAELPGVRTGIDRLSKHQCSYASLPELSHELCQLGQQFRHY